MKKILVIYSAIVLALFPSISCTKEENPFFSPDSIIFEKEGGTKVMTMGGTAATSTDFIGFYGIKEGNVFHYCSADEIDFQRDTDSAQILAASYKGLTVSVNTDKAAKKEFIIQAEPNETDVSKVYHLHFSHGNQMIIYKIRQR